MIPGSDTMICEISSRRRPLSQFFFKPAVLRKQCSIPSLSRMPGDSSPVGPGFFQFAPEPSFPCAHACSIDLLVSRPIPRHSRRSAFPLLAPHTPSFYPDDSRCNDRLRLSFAGVRTRNEESFVTLDSPKFSLNGDRPLLFRLESPHASRHPRRSFY